MSARKKTCKAPTKKQEETANKWKNASLLAFLKQKVNTSIETPERDNLTAEVLQALLEKDATKLDNLLALWGHDAEAVQHVAENLVTSKIPLLAQRIAEILENDQRKLYLYPWLEEIYATHHNKISQETNQKLSANCIVQGREIEELIKLQGKLSLILQQ